jgi:HEPN domain-containing protein
MSNLIDPWAEKLLLKAAEDEASIQIKELPDGPFGFHAQQAVEKLLKALLSQLNIVFDYTHDISKLAQQLSDAGESLPEGPVALSDLNKFAVIYRYDSIPSLEIPDRPTIVKTVFLIREHVVARIAALSSPPPLQ